VGYPVTELLAAIDHFLGWDNTTDAFLVGVGNLGRALLGYRGFAENGLRIQAAFDTDPVKLGTEIHGCRVLPLEKLSNLALRMHIQIGIITVPAEAAQGVADCMVEGGIRAVWNFAPAILKTPEAVFVENEHLSSSLAVLSRRLTRTTTAMDSPQD
jgi:redox-sensing transcriptional repressor